MQVFKSLKYLLGHPIGSKAKFKTIRNFLSWQLIQRIQKKPILMPFIGESVFLVEKGMTGATGNIYSGLHEFEDMAFLLHFLKKEDVFFDVGANIGSYTILAGKVIGAVSYSFEPSPTTFKHLENNIFLNRINENVKTFNMGIGAEQSRLFFSDGQDTTNHIVTNKNDASTEIEVESLDHIHEMYAVTPQLIKIDVEGFETNVIKGADKLLQNPKLKAIIMELNGSGGRYGFDENAVHEKVLNYGFKMYDYKPFDRELIPRTKRSFHGNTIYIRDIDAAKKRIESAPKLACLGVEF